MEYILQLEEALDDYDAAMAQEPRGGAEHLYKWSVRCSKILRRIEQLQKFISENEILTESR